MTLEKINLNINAYDALFNTKHPDMKQKVTSE